MHNYYVNSQVDKFLAVGLLMLCLLGGFIFFKNFYVGQIVSYIDEIEIEEKKTAKINSIIANEKTLKKKISQRKENLQRKRIFLENSNPTTASSELQNFVKKSITKYSRAKILTIKPYPVLSHDGYFETSLEIRLKNIAHAEIHKIVYRIENNAPLMLIKELEISRTNLQYKALVQPGEKDVAMNFVMVVSGFFREVGS